MTDLTNDAQVVAATAWGEARGEGGQGIQAVISVIANRVVIARATGRHQFGGAGCIATDASGNRIAIPRATFAAACLQPWQFSSWNSNDPNRAKLLTLDFDAPDDDNSQAVGLTQAQINANSTAGTNLVNGIVANNNNANMTQAERDAANQVLLNTYQSVVSAGDAYAKASASTTPTSAPPPGFTSIAAATDNDNQASVTALYNSLTGTNPTNAQLTQYATQLDNGTMTLTQLQNTLSTSPAAQAYAAQQAAAAQAAQQAAAQAAQQAAAQAAAQNSGWD